MRISVRTEQEAITQQTINRALTVDDVISSAAFNNALNGIKNDIPTEYLVTINDSDDGIVFQTANDGNKILKITIDYETGHLNYTIQGEQNEKN